MWRFYWICNQKILSSLEQWKESSFYTLEIMDINKVSINSVRKIVDQFFHCNGVGIIFGSINIEAQLPPNKSVINIAVANIVFLGMANQLRQELDQNINVNLLKFLLKKFKNY